MSNRTFNNLLENINESTEIGLQKYNDLIEIPNKPHYNSLVLTNKHKVIKNILRNIRNVPENMA